ncbi:MAG: Fe-S cluster assembly ATPase SufC [DPANN group archaeon]|nr:Fe-S cluster assembly ATPase SufC [DPANN group archaeon]
MEKTLSIKDLKVSVGDKEILRGISLEIPQGEIHALMGPNGSGKSTLAFTIMGHPKYKVTGGSITLGGKDVLPLAPDERARDGLFLSFQYPRTVSGVTVSSFLRQALQARLKKGQKLDLKEFMALLDRKMKLLDIDKSFRARFLNEGFSGGEKKRSEILQMAMLKPKIAILDETDSGLDIDALRIVAEGISKVADEKTGMLLITHYQRILRYITPDKVHVMVDGRIVTSGGKDLAERLEKEGYGWLQEA